MFLIILALTLAGSALGQTQINLSKQSRSVDFTGATYTRPFKTGTVLPAICTTGDMFYKTDAAPGSNLYGCSATNIWSVQAGSGGSSASVSGELTVELTSPGILTIGRLCTVAVPCNVRFGSNTFSVQSASTATLTAGSGTAFIYVADNGVLTVAHNLTLACSGGCVSQSGSSGFPPMSVPLYIWTATNGSWTGIGVDLRAILSAQPILSGVGLISTTSGGITTLGVDPSLVGLRTSVPVTSVSVCQANSWAADNSYFYLCVANNTWKRTGLSTW